MVNLKIGDTFIDCISNKEVLLESSSQKARVRKVVRNTTRSGSLVFGYTLCGKTPYSITIIYLDRDHRNYEAISSEIFAKDRLSWDHRAGYYLYSKDPSNVSLVQKKYVNRGCYRTPQDYSASSSIESVTEISKSHKKVFPSNLARQVPYTLGVEFETNNGTIPPDECFKAGLIPLRDGSISGLEYATIILDPSEDGFERLKYCVDLLEKYTTSDSDCSMHIHFGGFPLKLSYLYTVYRVCKRIEKELCELIPEYALQTSKFKRSGKDYCKKLPIFTSIDSFYEGFSNGEPYFGSLTQAHQSDLDGRQKWHLEMRYLYLNFMNALFYKRNKTLEFRFMAPTTNFNKIISWIYLLSAILKYSENISKGAADRDVVEIPAKLSLQKIIESVYTEDVCVKLMQFMKDLVSLRKMQEDSGDRCGALTNLDNKFFKSSIL